MTAKKKVLKKKAGPVFADSVSGTCGSFITPAGQVCYAMTKATLRFNGSPIEGEEETSKLTKFLAPVREVLDVANLGFDQLLQRDLDDNRIVYELIPYLLGSKRSGVPLFPPIVVVMLPHKDGKVADKYGKVSNRKVDHEIYSGDWDRTTYDSSFEVDRAIGDAATPNFGIVKWHYDDSRLVVLDGQHRAMALLGIHRTLNNDWKGNSSRFEVFYKKAVEAHMKSLGKDLPEVIELPVMLTWLPDKDTNLTEVVRKLFVDINSNARRPSPSRILLLSDNKLSNFLTRRLLSDIRSNSSDIPLSSVEYDYPSTGRSSVPKWSCYTNVEILKELIHWNVYRARVLAYNMNEDVMKKGKMAGDDVNMSLREELQVKTLGKKFDEGEEQMDPKKITNDEFPRFNKEKLNKLLDNFSELHAKPLIALFSATSPYKAHFTAMNEFEKSFDAEYGSKRINPTLCREALFEGQGVYWTIKHGAESPDGNSNHELSQCWKALSDDMRKDLESKRLKAYCGNNKSVDKDGAYSKFFDTLRTAAAQGGLSLLLCSIQKQAGIDKAAGRLKLAKAIGDGITKGLAKQPLILSPEGKLSLNRIGKLQPKFAGFWRYLWLEIMIVGIGVDGLKSHGVNKSVLTTMVTDARKHYFHGLINLRQRMMHRSNRSKNLSDFEEPAKKIVQAEIVDALSSIPSITKTAARKIWDDALSSKATSSSDNTKSDDDDDFDDDDFKPI